MARKTVAVKVKPSGKYVWQDFQNPPESKVRGYRTVKQGDHVIRVAILKGKGPRGGRTVATSIGHPIGERKSSDPQVQAALRRVSSSRKKGGR